MVQTGRIQSDQAGRINIERDHGVSIDRPYWSIEAAARYCVSLRCIGCAALLRVDTLELLGITSRSAAPEQPAAA
jgi:hypothetical protein